MKNLNLTNFDVQELNAKEMNVTDGGINVPGLLIKFVIGMIKNRDEVDEGWNSVSW